MTDQARRSAWLDCLRAIAAAMVFVRHAPFQIAGLETAQAGMRAGVVIFFALSGYLLFRPFAAAFDGRTKAVDLRRYAIHRLARILPAYLVATFALSALVGPGLLADPLGQATMLDTPIAVVWSLRVEIVFYALLPFIAMGVGRLSPRRRPTAILGIALLSFGTLLALTVAVLSGAIGVVPPFLEWPGAFWQFAPGMLVALAFVRRPDVARVFAGRRFLIVGLAILAVGVALDLEQYDVVDSVAAGLLIAHLISRPEPSLRAAKVFGLLGGASYAFYLWHDELLGALVGLGPVWATVVGLGLTLAVSFASWTFIEQPVIRMAQRWSRRAADARRTDTDPSPGSPNVGRGESIPARLPPIAPDRPTA